MPRSARASAGGSCDHVIDRGNARAEAVHKPDDDVAHVRRHPRHFGGSGHVWQGRFQAFPIRQDDHLLRVIRDVERDPQRAGPVERAEDWPWSSLRGGAVPAPDPGPAPRGPGWVESVNEPMTEADVAIRPSMRRDHPYGTDAWTAETASCLGLESSLRPRGRQPRTPVQASSPRTKSAQNP